MERGSHVQPLHIVGSPAGAAIPDGHVGGAKDMTKYSKCLRGVLKAVFHLSPSLILTKWHAFCKSSFIKIAEPWIGSKAIEISGKGYLFLTVIWFRPL